MKSTEIAQSSAYLWGLTARYIATEKRLGEKALAHGMFMAGVYEFLRFGIKQGWACLFGGIMVALLILTHFFYPSEATLTRYDFLVIAALTVQIVLLAYGLETWEEAKVIFLFHVVGTCMEIFKTAMGSWVYPEPSLLRIGGVPLFTGFMYASVGSYIARVWRLFNFRFTHHPTLPMTLALSVAIYINFFSHHYLPDMRVLLFLWAAFIFRRTWVYFKIWRTYRCMPLLLGFVLVALFIWLAENIGTLTGAWLYPHQHNGWIPVPMAKMESWLLLMIISYVMVSAISRPVAIEQKDSYEKSV